MPPKIRPASCGHSKCRIHRMRGETLVDVINRTFTLRMEQILDMGEMVDLIALHDRVARNGK